MAANYTYKTHTYGGTTLRIITTHASNIKLENTVENGAAKTVKNAGEYGINGAFFVQYPQVEGQYENMVLNIAYYNGKCLRTKVTNRADAYTNDIGKGVIGWDDTKVRFDAIVTDADELDYVFDKNTWAQGGVALWLGFNNWREEYIEQGGSIGSDARRTAMVCNLKTDMIYLIITMSEVSVEDFRDAIQDFFGITDSLVLDGTYRGIMLDGGGSTQMYFGSSIDFSSGRAIPEIIAVRNKN